MMTLPRYANLALKRCSENRDMAFAMSAATVGKLAAHPPVPRSKAMIPVSTVAGHSAPLTESDSPSACPAATLSIKVNA